MIQFIGTPFLFQSFIPFHLLFFIHYFPISSQFCCCQFPLRTTVHVFAKSQGGDRPSCVSMWSLQLLHPTLKTASVLYRIKSHHRQTCKHRQFLFWSARSAKLKGLLPGVESWPLQVWDDCITSNPFQLHRFRRLEDSKKIKVVDSSDLF